MNNAANDQLCINTMRFLAVDAVQKAKSGHPGMPLGASPMAYILWDRFLKHNPLDPKWTDRDRFILSAGHASAMLYSLLYLTGYDLSLEDLKGFRQWGSKTPGHPEYGVVPGVETTTGPLGQGFGNGVGMAIAEKWLATHYNRPGHEIIDHYTYAIVSDGDLEEGVSSEAASLAGTLKLGKLIYLYDDNDVSIEGNTNITFKENVGERFKAYDWQVIGPIDGNDLQAVESSIRKAQQDTIHPSLIICHTVIGFGSPNKAGSASTHGEPLGEEEVRATKKNLGWNYEETFFVPPEVLAHFRKAVERGPSWQKEWQNKFEYYRKEYPVEAKKFEESLKGNLPEGWDEGLDNLFKATDKQVSTRDASGQVINAVASKIEYLLGGSADLAPSTKTLIKNEGAFCFEDCGARNFHFGVREHSMGTVSNGMSIHGGLIPYAATFLIFYDYMRPPVRLAALMGIRVIYIYTHDSIGLGEDGPTHQPIEQLAGLRAVPNMTTVRPADAAETVEAWKIALQNLHGPTALILSRQNLPVFDRTKLAPAKEVQRGGYILWSSLKKTELIIISTGSEVSIALEAGFQLADKGIGVRVVSLPSWEIFDAQPEEYRTSVLPPDIRARISFEAAATNGWEKYVGIDGICIGLHRFGASAPYKIIYEKLGFTAQNIIEKAVQLLERKK